MEMFKKIGIRILALVIILTALNWIYSQYFFKEDLIKNTVIIEDVWALPENTEILYVGESSNITYSGDDIDKRPISEMLAEFYPEMNVNDITLPASHAGIYERLLRNVQPKTQIKTVVVTLNLRSFGANWIYSKLETPLQKKMVLLKDYPPLFNRFLLSFKGYEIKTEKEWEAKVRKAWGKETFDLGENSKYSTVNEWDKSLYQEGKLNADGTRNQELTELACHYVKSYAFDLDTLNNPRIKDFNKIIDYSKKMNWNIVFNLMAENIDRGVEMAGPEMGMLIQRNRDLLVSYFERRGVLVVDNLELVEDENYLDRDWTTEHYNELGRQSIARHLANELKNFHQEGFEEVEFGHYTQSYFFHDCEQKDIWGQMNTFTDEKAFSGQFSSKVFSDQPFSLTFENPRRIVPDSLFNSIHISCKIWAEKWNEKMNLVVEARGDSIEYFWEGKALESLNDEIQNWSDIQYDFKIPQLFEKAEVIKVYVHNPTDDPIYLDDLSIQFK